MLALLLSGCLSNAQAFKGKGDVKGQVGADFQKNGNGIHVSTDFGVGENMSYGFTATYLLGFPSEIQPEFGDKIDVKVRFNANIGNVFKMNSKMDIYPGLDLGLRNFGGHLGFRYFLTDGFGLFTEAGIPIATYKTNPTGLDYYHNQFVVNVGISFNL